MFKEVQNYDLTEVGTTQEDLKSSKHSPKDSENMTNTSNSDDIEAYSSKISCANNFSLNTVNTNENVEQTLQMCGDKSEMVNSECPPGTETQSSEKENLDDINCWLNDGLEYEDFESLEVENNLSQADTNVCKILEPAKCVTNRTVETVLDTANASTVPMSDVTVTSETAVGAVMMLNSKTSVAVVPENSGTTTTSKVVTYAHSREITSPTDNVTSFNMYTQHRSSESSKERLTTKSPRIHKKLSKTSGKQMDIGVYFGLKPKHKVTTMKTQDVSENALQRNDVVEKESSTQYKKGKTFSQTKKCPFYKIVEGEDFDFGLLVKKH